MRRAFSQLRHGRPGPVLVEIPTDLATAEFPGDLDYHPVKACKSASRFRRRPRFGRRAH